MSPIRSLLRGFGFSRNTHRIRLLGRPGCHLCDDARAALEPVFGRAMIDEVDITTDPALEDLYVFRIPVVLFEEQVIAEGIIDRAEAKLALRKVREIASGRAEAR